MGLIVDIEDNERKTFIAHIDYETLFTLTKGDDFEALYIKGKEVLPYSSISETKDSESYKYKIVDIVTGEIIQKDPNTECFIFNKKVTLQNGD